MATASDIALRHRNNSNGFCPARTVRVSTANSLFVNYYNFLAIFWQDRMRMVPYFVIQRRRRRLGLCLHGPTMVLAWWGGPAPWGIEAVRVRVCRRWRGTANREAAAVCRCRTRSNGEPTVPRQSQFESFPAHREQLLWPTPRPSPYASTVTSSRREARQKSDSSACYTYTRATHVHVQAHADMRYAHNADGSSSVL